MSPPAARGTLDAISHPPRRRDAMSTVSEEHVAPTAAPTPTIGRGRALRFVFGSLALVVALALIGGAIAAIVGLETNQDSTGYFVTHTHHYQTSSYALSTESLSVGGVTGALEAGLVRLRISATSSEAAKPLFVGIARTSEVNLYLAGIAHDELRDINFDPFRINYRRLGTAAPRTPPSMQSFWQAHTSGVGTQTISWPVKRGDWSAVVMNADGSRNVGVDAQLAARLSGAWWFVVAFIVLGALSLLGGAALIRSGARMGAPETTAASEV